MPSRQDPSAAQYFDYASTNTADTSRLCRRAGLDGPAAPVRRYAEM